MDGSRLQQLSLLKVWDRLAHCQETFSVDEVARIYREPSILTGYRKSGQPWSYYLASLFQVHNETINIWTHILAVFLYLHVAYFYISQVDFTTHPDAIGILGFTFCVCLNVGLSALAHLLHTKSEYDHHFFYQLDFLGCSLFNQGESVLLYFCVATAKFHQHFGTTYLFLQMITGVFFFNIITYAKLKYKRPYPPARRKMMVAAAAVQGVTVWLPIYYKLYEHFPLTEEQNWTYLAAYTWFGLAIAAYSFDQPESTFPGWCDILGHSHQWWHIFMMLTTTSSFKIGYTGLLLKPPEDAPPLGVTSMVVSILGLIILSLLCQIIFHLPKTLSICKINNNCDTTSSVKEKLK